MKRRPVAQGIIANDEEPQAGLWVGDVPGQSPHRVWSPGGD